MLSINVSSFSKPSGYQLSTLPKPVVAEPTDVVINVHAASINPIDAHKAGGDLSIAVKDA
jgi:NADPH:quinone reductase-like Zn-dependent oxidoreductase